ncbi:hypothetical protein EYF80_030013 [Liparis tanakae]|uniref:Uncharacterized protein n=1 Tax=Liparis tanakae TaxID=230148 RepID=A0A4Z2H1S8_9TELE|nr:hypothetical protein EYF80_030013 [Liparis tanakae]
MHLHYGDATQRSSGAQASFEDLVEGCPCLNTSGSPNIQGVQTRHHSSSSVKKLRPPRPREVTVDHGVFTTSEQVEIKLTDYSNYCLYTYSIDLPRCSPAAAITEATSEAMAMSDEIPIGVQGTCHQSFLPLLPPMQQEEDALDVEFWAITPIIEV